MGDSLTQIIDNWVEGVNTSLTADRIPENAAAHGYNSAFAGVGQGKIVVQKRLGLALVNATPITSIPAIIGQWMHKLESAGAYTTYHLLVDSLGGLKRRSSGTLVAADAVNPTPFTSGNYYPSFANANNLCFAVNGQEAKKFDGTNVTTFGITRPTVGTLAGAAGAAGSPNGTYELRATYYNSATGHESSASNTATATVTVASQVISTTNIPVSADTQVTHTRVYVRNTSTMNVFYLAGTVTAGTTTATLDFVDANLVTQAPSTTDNDPPPSGAEILAWHQSRMFASDGLNVYYSSIEKPEAFNLANYTPANPEDGQQITGLYSALEILLIFKRQSVYGLFGTDPNSWEVKLLLPNTGCTSFRTVCAAEGSVYWHSDAGLMKMSTPGELDAIGPTYLRETFEDINFTELARACAVADVVHNRILLALPASGESRNTYIVPFNYRIGRFESDKWNPMDAASLGTVDDASGNPLIYLGGYSGQLFQMWSGANDGVTSGDSSKPITSIAGSSTIINSTAAAFNTTGGGLVERAVYFISPAGTRIVRRRITANTATQFTFTPALTELTTSWTYQIGAIQFQWDTPWLLMEPRFVKKRLRHLYLTVDGDMTIYVDVFTNYAETLVDTVSFAAVSGGSAWGALTWGTDLWGEAAPYTGARLRLGRTATAARFRVRDCTTNEAMTLSAIGVSGELKSDRVN